MVRAGTLDPRQNQDKHNLVIVDFLEEHVRLPTRSPVDSKTDFIPGGQGEKPAKKPGRRNSRKAEAPAQQEESTGDRGGPEGGGLF